MQDWLLEGLQQYVGRNDRESLGPRIEHALAPQSMGDHQSYRVARNLPSLTRGLVVVEQGVIPDYSRVRRVFHLTLAEQEVETRSQGTGLYRSLLIIPSEYA